MSDAGEVIADIVDACDELSERYVSGEWTGVVEVARWLRGPAIRSLGVSLAPEQVIDIAGDCDLAERWHAARELDGEPSEPAVDDVCRDVAVSLDAVRSGAAAAVEKLEHRVSGLPLDDDGEVALTRMSRDAVAALAVRAAEWAFVCGEAVLGYYRVKGYLPDTWLGGGSLAGERDSELVSELAATLGVDLC